MRLSSHPSIIVWGGNNEIETSLEWYEETRSNPHLFAVDYAALFLDVIQKEVQQVRYDCKRCSQPTSATCRAVWQSYLCVWQRPFPGAQPFHGWRMCPFNPTRALVMFVAAVSVVIPPTSITHC
jgi:hypothetical protein